MRVREETAFEAFVNIMETLLGENGCPWDRAQTHESLRPYLLEECYEATEAIDQHDMAALCEELGDVLMEVVFHAKLAERASSFTMDDVLAGISQKLINRHSHIFGTDKAATAAEVEGFWEANKNKEKKYQNTVEMLNAVPKAMPALMRAEKVLKRAKKAGFADFNPDEKPTASCFQQAHALLDRLESQCLTGEGTALPDGRSASEYFGELLLILVRISLIIEINAEFSLTNAVEAFITSN